MTGISREVRIAPNTDGDGRIPALSPREAKQRVLSRQRVDKVEATVPTYGHQLQLFVEGCDNEGIVEVRDLTGRGISYETHRCDQTIKPITVKKAWHDQVVR